MKKVDKTGNFTTEMFSWSSQRELLGAPKRFQCSPKENDENCHFNLLLWWLIFKYLQTRHTHSQMPPIRTRKTPKMEKKQTQDKLDIYSWLLSAGFPSLWTHICLQSFCLFATKGGTSDTSGAFQLAARLRSAVFFSFCIFCHFYVVYYSCEKNYRKHNNNC